MHSIMCEHQPLQRQINFIRDRVVDKELWQDYERLALWPYADIDIDHSRFNTLHQHRDLVLSMGGARQRNEPSILENTMDWFIPTPDHSHSITFISYINNSIVIDTGWQVKNALDANHTITIIAMGKGAPASLVQQLDPRVYVVEWNIEEEVEPAHWQHYAWRTFGCSMLMRVFARLVKGSV